MGINMSMLDISFEYLNETGTSLPFTELWKRVTERLGWDINDERIGVFYTNLTLDGRFVALKDNCWNLRSREKFENYHIEMKDAYAEVEDTEDDKQEAKEEVGDIDIGDEEEDIEENGD